MWKIKLASKNKEESEVNVEKPDVNLPMTTENKEVIVIVDDDSSAKKKYKQARLPFQILSPKEGEPIKKNDQQEDQTARKRKLSDSSVEVKTKICKNDDVKENFCKPVSDSGMIVIDDSSVECEVVNEECDSNNKNVKIECINVNNAEKDANSKTAGNTSLVDNPSTELQKTCNDAQPIEIGNVQQLKCTDSDKKSEKKVRRSVKRSVNSGKCLDKSNTSLKDVPSILNKTSPEPEKKSCNAEKPAKGEMSDKKNSNTKKKPSKKITKTRKEFALEQKSKETSISNQDENRVHSTVIIVEESPVKNSITKKETEKSSSLVTSKDKTNGGNGANNLIQKTVKQVQMNLFLTPKSETDEKQQTLKKRKHSEESLVNSKTKISKIVADSMSASTSSDEQNDSGSNLNEDKDKSICSDSGSDCIVVEKSNADKNLDECITVDCSKSDVPKIDVVKTALPSKRKNKGNVKKKIPNKQIQKKTVSNQQTLSPKLRKQDDKKKVTNLDTSQKSTCSEQATSNNDSDSDFMGFEKSAEDVNLETKTFSIEIADTPKKTQLKQESVVTSEEKSPDLKTSSSSKSESQNQIEKTPSKRRLTPKQILKKQESEKKRQEKDKLKEEKEREKHEKKEKMNKLKEERQKMKIEKEESKKREKEEKEKKRQLELELKNEEKRAKEEEKKVKEEEKRKREEAKEEERRKRDEAKEEERKKKDAEKKKEEKAASAFASFFTPLRSENKLATPNTEDIPDVKIVAEKFMPFEVKPDMKLAVTTRRTLDNKSKEFLDSVLEKQISDKAKMYIVELKSKNHVPMSDGKTWPLFDDSENDVIIIESEVVEENNEEEKKVNLEKKRSHRLRAKLLQFHENQRPPYWGTWRKKSSTISARTPFNQDNAHFEYDIDSDEEWEEEEPGESLHGSDDEKESEDEYEVDNKVFVPHGYLSDEEGQDEIEDMSPEAQKAKLKLLESEFEAEMKEKTEKLKPRLIGCVWFDNSVEDSKSAGSYIAELLLSRKAVVWDNVNTPIEVEFLDNITSSPNADQTPAKVDQNKINKSNLFPESAMPSLIRLVHGNRFKHRFLVDEFLNYLATQSTGDLPTKTAIANKKREISEWMPYTEDDINHPMIGRSCWCVSKEVRKKYGVLTEDYKEEDAWTYTLEVPLPRGGSCPVSDQTPPVTPTSKPAVSITKFTKVLSQEERQKQLKSQSKSSTDTSGEKVKSNGKTSNLGKTKMKWALSNAKKSLKLMSAFTKGKSNSKDNSDVEIIELSPEKSTIDSSRPADVSNCDITNTAVMTDDVKLCQPTENDNSKMSAVKSSTKPIKRITPICISPKHKKKIKDN